MPGWLGDDTFADDAFVRVGNGGGQLGQDAVDPIDDAVCLAFALYAANFPT